MVEEHSVVTRGYDYKALYLRLHSAHSCTDFGENSFTCARLINQAWTGVVLIRFLLMPPPAQANDTELPNGIYMAPE